MPFLYQVQYGFLEQRGKGLYASEDIPAGATYWTLMPHPQQVPVKGAEIRRNTIYTEEELYALTENQKKQMISCGFFFSKGNVLISLFDGCYYFNHDSQGPSLTIFDGDLQKMHSIMTRDVRKGEQLTEDYCHWNVKDSPCLEKVMKEYFPVRYEFQMQICLRRDKREQQQ